MLVKISRRFTFHVDEDEAADLIDNPTPLLDKLREVLYGKAAPAPAEPTRPLADTPPPRRLTARRVPRSKPSSNGHTRSGEFGCPVCGKTFRTAVAMKIHKGRVHQGAKTHANGSEEISADVEAA